MEGRRLRSRWLALVSFSGLLLAAPSSAHTSRPVPTGSVFRFLDDGSDPGTQWRSPSFDDSAWLSGPAQLGYGDGDERTVVGFGPDPGNKHVTTYFRHSFQVVDLSTITSVRLRVLRDDGAVVFLNGSEVFRSNMPPGDVDSTTLAATAVGGSDENAFQEIGLAPQALVEGANLLAVEIHQVSPTSSDISFDLELVTVARHVSRGPYLQRGASDGIVLRWRTDTASTSRVRYGLSPDALSITADDSAMSVEHEVELSGLAPDTRYFYSVGTITDTLLGGDADHFFSTSPLPGAPKATRIWVVGDSGTFHMAAPDLRDAKGVRDSYLRYSGAQRADLWLMLGDNAYNFGTDDEYQRAVFEAYPMLLRNTVLWPTFGNHDAVSADAASETGPYFDDFTLPRNGEAGGFASGTEAYYSFDFGNIHWICLDSSESDRTGGAMLTWLSNDLAANSQDWTIAFWHHPPYTKGTHDSDQEGELIEMREHVLPILEAGGVDLVLSGHSHDYERSFLVDGFYRTPSTIDDGTILDGGDGRPGAGGAYAKPTKGPAPHEGAVYAVVGSSGRAEPPTHGLLHPVMFDSRQTMGSMILDIEGDTLAGRFIDRSCAVVGDPACVRDFFRIQKGVPRPEVTVDLSSSVSTVPIGASLAFRLALDNTTSEAQNVFLLFFLSLPGGQVVPLGSEIPLSFPPGVSFATNTALGPFSSGTPLGTWLFGAILLRSSGSGKEVVDLDYLRFVLVASAPPGGN